MHKHRLPYAAAFRQQMIDLVHAGRTPEDLAKEFGPTAQTIYNNWVAQADSDTGKRHDGLTTTEREELTRLRRKVKQLEVEKEIQAVANALNTRPRKTLGWKTPAEALDEYLKSVQECSVATTG
ncbi:MAG: hypothetical protein ACN6OP_06795 [Pseudomonadales bacterium]